MFPDVIGDDVSVKGLRAGQTVETGRLIKRTLYAAATPQQIAAGGTFQFAIRLQVPMRLEQLVIVSEELGPLTLGRVTELRVGPNNQIVSNGGAMSARSFAPDSFMTNMLEGNTALNGVDVLVTIAVPAAGQAETFVVHVKGTALVPQG